MWIPNMKLVSDAVGFIEKSKVIRKFFFDTEYDHLC